MNNENQRRPRIKRITWIVAAALWLLVPIVRGQQNPPHAGYVYPAGGRQGDTFRVRVGGQFLDGVDVAYFSEGGVQARIVDFNRPLNAQQLNSLRERAQELQKKGRDAAVLKELAEIRAKIVGNMRRNINPALSQTVTLEVAVSPDADPGRRQLRLGTPLGLSNPLVFEIGQLQEFREPEPSNADSAPRPERAENQITLPATVNGRIMPGGGNLTRLVARGQQFLPGDVDRYRFQARKGQQLVAAVAARDLMPYLADAVPGWFQAVIAIYDAHGKELAYDDDYRFQPDPVLHLEVPEDGEYVVEIRDALYRGRDDFVYRITIGEIPFVTGIFPLGGRTGARTTVQLTGWNLPVTTVTMDGRGKSPGVYPLTAGKGNSIPFALDDLPESGEKEPNDSQKEAQQVKFPITVNGHIERPGEWDVFSFKGRAREEIVAEVQARRLDSQLDSVLRLTDSKGRQIAFNDDHEDKGRGLDTHHADSLLGVTLPANGTYYLYVGDAQQKGGADYAYRLSVRRPRPDFELRIVPSGINAIVGPTVPITVYALRKDGFAGEIALALKDAPRGFTLSGGLVQSGQDRAQLTLTVPPASLREPLTISLEGRATIDGKQVVRTAVPADDMMQAFAYHHLVTAKDLRVAATGRGPSQAALKVLAQQPLKIPAGGAARVQIAMPAVRLLEKIQFELNEAPEGISVRESALTRQGAEFIVQCDADKAKSGLKGNLIVNISGERVPPAGNQQAPAAAARRRIPLGTLPAIPFEIIPR